MTTDAALIRPGRVDMKVEVGKATQDMVFRAFVNFFPGEEQRAMEFVRAIPDGSMSMAEIQSVFVEHNDDVNALIAKIKIKQQH